jgi:protein-S-isoprenylcysteine O-methyltransferase Ste14
MLPRHHPNGSGHCGQAMVYRPRWAGFFSGAVRVQKDQMLVESGPYRYVHHPSYAGALSFFVGLGLAFQSWGAVLALALIFAVVYGYRMYVDGKILILELGEAYISYSRRTKRLIPYVF